MLTRTRPTTCETPLPTDGPFLLAALIGAKRAGDSDRARFLRDCLREIGVSVRFSRSAPALAPRPHAPATPTPAH